MNAHKTSLSLLLAGLIAVAGCSAKVSYRSLTPVNAATSANVALEVVDARDASLVGADKSRVGNVRNGWGMPFGVHEDSPDRIPQLVTEATADALRQAGVGIDKSASRVLVAQVKDFWVDGYVGYKSMVDVEYSLRDRDGKQLWTFLAQGASGGMPWGGTSFAEEYLTKALADCSVRAAQQFQQPAFQKLVF